MPGGVAFLCQGHFSRRTDPSESSGCSSGLNYFGKVKVRWPVDRSATNVLEKGDKDAWSGESLARWKTGLPRPILVERHGVGTKGERRLSSPEVLPQSRRSSSALFARECRKALRNLPVSIDLSRPRKELYHEFLMGSASDPLVEWPSYLLGEV